MRTHCITNTVALMAGLSLHLIMAAQPLTGDSLPQAGYVDLHTHLTTKYFYAKTTGPSECIGAGGLPERLSAVNWESHGIGSRKWRKCKPSTYGNYYQANYSELRQVPGSILLNCIYPLEKQLTVKKGKRRISSCVVTHIPYRRLSVNASDSIFPWDEFMGEYCFAVDGLHKDPRGALTIRYPRDRAELIEHIQDGNTINALFTVEGGQVLYGPEAGEREGVRFYDCDGACASELLRNVDNLRQLPHRVFFIAPAHFTDNFIVGNAKTLDRKGVTRVLVHGVSGLPVGNKSLFNKWGEGIHGELDIGEFDKVPGTSVSLPSTTPSKTDTIGRAVFTRLLEPRQDLRHPEPVYIDLKHMDVQARFEYYALHKELEEQWGIRIPIIASHIAVSGEDSSIAMATGLNPLYDRYPELRNPLRFYRKEERKKSWGIRNKELHGTATNPFAVHIDETTAGWFYPWSINLADEEFAKIHESDGIMGLMLDGRQLGIGMKKYNGAYKRTRRKAFQTTAPVMGLAADKDVWENFWTLEPMMRNIVHIVEHCGRAGACWNHLAIGSDMDGLIAPMKVCRTTGDIPALRQLLIDFLPLFARLEGKADLCVSGTFAREAMDKVFYTNGRDFILKYY